jgi:hypothetical protein
MIALLLAGLAEATTYARPLTVDDLAERSDHALAGRVLSVEGVLRGGRIWTLARVDADSGPDMDVWALGGCIPGQDLCMTVAGSPRPEPGTRVFLFLERGRVTGMAQGFFVLDGGTGVRDLSGIVFADGGSAPTRVSLTELEAAAARVRSAKQ